MFKNSPLFSINIFSDVCLFAFFRVKSPDSFRDERQLRQKNFGKFGVQTFRILPRFFDEPLIKFKINLIPILKVLLNFGSNDFAEARRISQTSSKISISSLLLLSVFSRTCRIRSCSPPIVFNLTKFSKRGGTSATTRRKLKFVILSDWWKIWAAIFAVLVRHSRTG